MNPGDDLTPEALAAVLGDRRLQCQPVMLSTAVTAADWASSGAPNGSVVVADQQIAPRGRAGKPWQVRPGQDLSFALILHPELESEREGWLYAVMLAALADSCGDGLTIEWPDELHREGVMTAAVGINVRLGGPTIKWAAVNVLIRDATSPRGELLGSVLQAVDERLAGSPRAVLDDYAPLCRTIGRHVRIRLLGGTSRLEGRAIEALDDGGLLLEIGDGRHVPVRPQDISTIESA